MKDNLDIPFSRPYRIYEDNLDQFIIRLANLCTCSTDEIKCSFDPKNGYRFYFIAPDGVEKPIAHILWENNHYQKPVEYIIAIDEVCSMLKRQREQARERALARQEERKAKIEQEKQRKFKLQKYKTVGKRVAVGALISFLVFAAGAKISDVVIDQVNAKNATVITFEQSLNSIGSANDIILAEWIDYAMSEVTDSYENSEWKDQLQYQVEYLKTSYYIPTASAYYDYVERIEADMPDLLDGDLKERYHTRFRDNAIAFNDELKAKGYNSATFSNSPFANAVVVDSLGNIVTNDNNGVIYDSNGELIYDRADYSIYVRANDIENNNYSLDNLPSDARFINGEAYVLISHLKDFTQGEVRQVR